MQVLVKKLTETAILPKLGSEQAAGVDLYADIDQEVWIPAHETVKIGTGLSFELPEGTFGAIFARSGLATKQGLRPANAVGVCDSDYRGEYIVAVHNDTNIAQCVPPHSRIAQLVLLPYLPMKFIEVNDLSKTERNDGGFGSTGA